MPPASSSAAGIEAAGYSHQQVLTVISGVVLCILLAALDQTVVIPAVPAIAAELNGFGHLAWIVTAYLLTSTIATPVYGRLSDLHGRRALLLPAIALFVAASMLCGFASSLWQLIAFRALQGLGGAGLMSMAQASIADVISPRERGRYQGYMAGMWGVASVAGPSLGGWLTDDLSWRWIFWLNLPVGAAAFWLCHRGLRILPVRHVRARFDFLGLVLLSFGVTAWLLLLGSGRDVAALTSPSGLALAGAGTVLLASLAWQERRAPDPLLPPRMFANSTFTRGVTLAFLASLGLFAATFMLPLYFQLVRGLDAASSGLAVMPFLVANVAGALLSGQVARRLGKTKIIVISGFSMAVLGFLLCATLGVDSSLLTSAACSALLGIGIGICMPSVLVMVQNAAERRDVGAATGALLLLRSMGGAFGSTLAGTLLAARFAAASVASGMAGNVDLGTMRRGGAAIAALPQHAQAVLLNGLDGGVRLTFEASAAFMLIALVVCVRMRDLPLRTTSASEPVAAGH